MHFRITLLALFLISTNLFAINNPVVTIYDGCIMKFGGKFYAMGTGTDGKIYWSDDMITWAGPLLVAKTDKATWPAADQEYHRVGAGDLVYHNGLFHIYYNGIGHSVSTWPTKMFEECSLDKSFTPEDIDPQLFIDRDGTPIFIKKVQKYNPLTGGSLSGGPDTWQFPLITPFSLGANNITGDGQAKFLNTGLKGANCNLDKWNFEGPELYFYRDNYYLLNSTNTMSSRTGLYNAFCTQSTSLSTMNNSSKIPTPVLERNLELFHRQYKVIAPFSEYGAWNGRMTTITPASSWSTKDFNDSGWGLFPMGIGAPKQDRDVDIRHVRTLWNSNWNTVYVRREFNTTEIPAKPFILYRSEGNFEYYLNGTLLFTESAKDRGWKSKEIPASAFAVGRNVLAVKCTANGTLRYFDAGVYDAGSLKVEEPVIGPSQVNLLTGINGFEHFIVYKAFWNGISAQGVDRVFFHGKKLTTNGPTTASSNGYHAAPSKPSLFTGFDALPSAKHWNYQTTNWLFGMGKAKSNTERALLLTKTKAENYYLEASFALAATGTERAGLMLWYENDNNYMELLVSRANNQWMINTMNNGVLSTTTHTLPSKFKFFEANPFVTETTPAMHELRIYKNANKIDVWLDHFLLTLNSPLSITSNNAGFCGISAEGKNIEFEHIAYTKGWDEHSAGITGWEGNNAAWNVTAKGISLLSNPASPETLFKGDNLTNQNFEINISNPTLPSTGKVVVYPVYTDANNFLQATMDYSTKKWTINGKANGQNIQEINLSAQAKVMRVHTLTTATANPVNNYIYNLDSESLVSAIKILWLEGAYPYSKGDFTMPVSYKVQYNNGSAWVDVPNIVAEALKFSQYNVISFSPIKTKALRITTVPPTGKHCRPYDIELTVDAMADFFFRSARDGNNTHLFYNNQLMATVNADFGNGQVGFGSTIKDCTFDGIMCYQNAEITDNEISTTTSSINTEKDNLYKTYLANKKFVVESSAIHPYNISIYNSLGGLVFRRQNLLGKTYSDISGLSNSVYLAKIHTETELLQVTKFTIFK